MRPLADRRGFTLVELIIALAIVGSLLVVAFGGLRVAVSAWRRGDERIEAQQHMRSLSLTLARSLSGAYPYRDARRQGETSVLLFRGTEDRVEFVTHASPSPTAIPVAFTAVIVELHNYGDRVVLMVRQQILPNREPFLESQIVLEDPSITALELSYLGDGGWQSEWDAEEQTALPRAVKIALGTGAPDGSRPAPSVTVALGGARK
jgi:prepilin-type N-terminal cleavage/methylation domain-containing protein